MPPSEAQQRVIALATGFRTAAVVITFAELGLGTVLSRRPRSVAELAALTGTDSAALQRFLRAAALLGLVQESEQGWENTELAAETLVADSPHSLVHFIANQAALYRRWSQLTEAVRTGRPPEASRSEERTPDWVRRFTLMLCENARMVSGDVAASLLPLLDGIHSPRVLDLGGGHGEYAMALARARSDLQAVVFDLPPVIEVTRELVTAQGLMDRIELRAGDFTRDSIGGGYHLVLLFGVLNGMDAAEAQTLLRSIAPALVPGGWLAIRATPPHPSPEAALQHALMDLQMLLATERGRMPEPDTLERWLADASFSEIRWQRTSAASEVTLLLARR